MGRPRIEADENYQWLVKKRQSINESKKAQLENASRFFEARKDAIKNQHDVDYAQAISDAIDRGLSMYAIGKATGWTSSMAKESMLQWVNHTLSRARVEGKISNPNGAEESEAG